MSNPISLQAFCTLLIAVCLGTAAAESESPFPSQQVTPGQTGVANVTPVTKVKLKWQIRLPGILSHQSVQTVLAPNGKSLYLTAGGSLLKVDSENGKIEAQINAKLIGHPTLSAGYLYATGANFVCAYDISGEKPVEKWKYSTAEAFESESKYNHAHRSGPVVAGKLVLFGQAGGIAPNTKLFAVEAETGKLVWTFDAKGQIRSPAAVDAAGGMAFIAGSGAGLFAVDLSTGREKWHTQLSGAAFSGPSFADQRVYCGTETELMAINSADGKEIWRVKHKAASSRHSNGHSVIVNNELAVLNIGATVEAYDRKDGAFKWTYAAAGEGGGFMVAARDVLYVPDFSSVGFVHAIRLKDGSALWTHQAPDGHHKCDYVGVGEGRVYYSSLGGNLFCLENEK